MCVYIYEIDEICIVVNFYFFDKVIEDYRDYIVIVNVYYT